MVVGPVGGVGVHVQLLVFMKDAILKMNFVNEHAPTLFHLPFHVAMPVRALTQKAALAEVYRSAQLMETGALGQVTHPAL